MAARITQEVVDMRNQLKCKDEELLKHKEEGLFDPHQVIVSAEVGPFYLPKLCTAVSIQSWFLVILLVIRLEEELRVSQERIKSLNSMSDSKVEKWVEIAPLKFLPDL